MPARRPPQHARQTNEPLRARPRPSRDDRAARFSHDRSPSSSRVSRAASASRSRWPPIGGKAAVRAQRPRRLLLGDRSNAVRSPSTAGRRRRASPASPVYPATDRSRGEPCRQCTVGGRSQPPRTRSASDAAGAAACRTKQPSRRLLQRSGSRLVPDMGGHEVGDSLLWSTRVTEPNQRARSRHAPDRRSPVMECAVAQPADREVG